MYRKQKLGKEGEECACKYLLKNNYKIIEKNFYCRQGEIDIIAKDLTKEEIVFIEVKTRTSCLYGRPSEAVNYFKLSHLRKSANYYIYKNNLEKFYIRIDVIEIYLIKNKMIVNHIKQVV